MRPEHRLNRQCDELNCESRRTARLSPERYRLDLGLLLRVAVAYVFRFSFDADVLLRPFELPFS